MRSVWGLAACAMMVIASTSIARADKSDDATAKTYRTSVDRADLERSSVGGQRLRVYVSGVALQGQAMDLSDPKSLKLVIGGSEKKEPYALGIYNSTTADTAMALCIQASATFSDVMKPIADAIDAAFLDLNDRTQIAMLMYGDSVSSTKFMSPKGARGKIGDISSDGSAAEPALSDCLDRALAMLKKAKTPTEGRPIRKIVVVIGDGRDAANDRERITKTGQRALKDGVRIHSVAYSPTDARRTLLSLGELSKQSHGTFRWIRGKGTESWTPAFDQLHDEVGKQYVVTYFFDDAEELAGKKLHIQTLGRIETTSNEIKIPVLSCSSEPCEVGYCADDHCLVPLAPSSRGIVGWLVLVVGIVVGAAVVLGLIGFVMSKRQKSPKPPKPFVPAPPAFGSQPPATGAMGAALPAQPITGPVTGPSLLVISGPRTGERFALRHGFLVGKAPSCDLVIDDGYTSSQHAQFAMDDSGNCRLYDKGSTNGTYVNGVRIAEQGLAHGVGVRIGSTELRFLSE